MLAEALGVTDSSGVRLPVAAELGVGKGDHAVKGPRETVSRSFQSQRDAHRPGLDRQFPVSEITSLLAHALVAIALVGGGRPN